MYQQGTLDNHFLMRESNNIIELIVSEKCGSFFGPWWSPNNPLMSAMQKNPEAEWQPYLIRQILPGAHLMLPRIPVINVLLSVRGISIRRLL